MLCIVGGGKMGLALAAGVLSEREHDEITIVQRGAERRAEVEAWVAENHYQRVTVVEAPVPCDGAIIAVKPKDVEMAVNDAVSAGAKRLLSVAAGIPVQRLHEWAGGRIPVVRAMPNIGAMVRAGAIAVTGSTTTHATDLNWAEELLRPCGTVVRVSEDQMDAVTGLSGSGPAYLFLVAEAMIDAGVHAGLSHDVARSLVDATFLGTGALLDARDDHPAQLRATVTTPAGTTAAGLQALEEHGVRAAFIDAVAAAAERSRQIGRPSPGR